jgi:uncharacterized protein (DUF1330 family)
VRIDGGAGSPAFARHWPRYEALASPAVTSGGGTILAADDAPVVLEGSMAALDRQPRVVLGRYPSAAAAAAVFTSAEYGVAAVHRRAASSSDILVLEGQPAVSGDELGAGRRQPRGYHVIILELLSEELYAQHWPDYERVVGPAVELYGGNVLAVDPAAVAIEIAAQVWREGVRCVVVEYETVGQARAMYESDQYQRAAAFRWRASTCLGFLLVQGVMEPAGTSNL